MSQINASTGQQDATLQFAASHYGIPVSILKGVYAIETDSGRNIATSSAGAQGAFQFIPSTAAKYGYPLTNTVDSSTFTQQSYAAAHYLSDLVKQHGGDWNAALEAYSGGGYGLAQVQQKAGGSLTGTVGAGPLGTAGNDINAGQSAVENAVNAVGNIPGAITGVFNAAVNDAKYAAVLVAALVVAVVLMTHAFRGSGGDSGRKIVPVPV